MVNLLSPTPNPELSHLYHRLDELRNNLPSNPSWWTPEQEQAFLLLQNELFKARKASRAESQAKITNPPAYQAAAD